MVIFMIGTGTLINTAAVVVGGCAGLIVRKGIKPEIQKAVMQACGIATIFIGISGTLAKMLVVGDSGITTRGTMLLIFSLVIGTLVGELVRIEDKIDRLGEKIKKLAHRDGDASFVEGFVNSSLIICVGAMAVVGSIEDGISGDFSMLAAKAVLDGIIVMILASTYGIGTVFSAIPIFVYQGLITLAAYFCGSFASESLIDGLSFVGSALIFCVGINIAFGKRFKVGNMLPALIIPAVYELVKQVMQVGANG